MGPWAWVCNRTKMKSLRFSSAGFVDLCAQPAKCVYIHTQLLFSQKLPLCCRNRTMEAFWRHWVNGYPVICSFCHFSANPLSRLDSWTSCPEIDITSTFSQLNESTPAPADEEGLRCAPGLTCLKLPFPWRIFLLIPFWRQSVIMQSDFHSNLFYIHYYYCRMGNMGYFCSVTPDLTANSYWDISHQPSGQYYIKEITLYSELYLSSVLYHSASNHINITSPLCMSHQLRFIQRFNKQKVKTSIFLLRLSQLNTWLQFPLSCVAWPCMRPKHSKQPNMVIIMNAGCFVLTNVNFTLSYAKKLIIC